MTNSVLEIARWKAFAQHCQRMVAAIRNKMTPEQVVEHIGQEIDEKIANLGAQNSSDLDPDLLDYVHRMLNPEDDPGHRHSKVFIDLHEGTKLPELFVEVEAASVKAHTPWHLVPQAPPNRNSTLAEDCRSWAAWSGRRCYDGLEKHLLAVARELERKVTKEPS